MLSTENRFAFFPLNFLYLQMYFSPNVLHKIHMSDYQLRCKRLLHIKALFNPSGHSYRVQRVESLPSLIHSFHPYTVPVSLPPPPPPIHQNKIHKLGDVLLELKGIFLKKHIYFTNSITL